MGKISPVSSKYIVNASIEIEGVVDRPDVIGAIFGQTEGLLGADLELRELQRSGRIGRIEVNVETRAGKSFGSIIIPSSLDKAETAIVAASLEIIQRIGPCNAKIHVQKIEDVRISKREFVISRAKELLKSLQDLVMPDSQELAEEVSESIRVMEITEYGKDRLPAGPGVDESDEVIVVEGRADVLAMLKSGFKNVIAMNGTSCPPTVVELSRKKDIVLFCDGDRGGNLIIKEMMGVADIDFVTRAPDGKEVEELTKKEIHKALRSRITAEQARLELNSIDTSNSIRRPVIMRPVQQTSAPQPQGSMMNNGPRIAQRPAVVTMPEKKSEPVSSDEKKVYGEFLEGLIGTRGALILDEKLQVLGKVPFSELATTVKSLNSGIHAVVFDGVANDELVSVAESAGVKRIIAMDAQLTKTYRVPVITADQL